MTSPKSADRLRGLLARHHDALVLYQTQALYHLQVDWACRLLDIVDETAGTAAGQLAADAIGERMARDALLAAVTQGRSAQARHSCLTLDELRAAARLGPIGGV